MGGLTTDKNGSVLDRHKKIIPGLHPVGEVSGGVHRDNCLDRNSFEVYGTIVGQKITIKQQNSIKQNSFSRNTGPKQVDLPKISIEVLREHNSDNDCWIAIHGKVYDITEFAEEHTAGLESIRDLAGQYGTEACEALHSENALKDFDPIEIMI